MGKSKKEETVENVEVTLDEPAEVVVVEVTDAVAVVAKPRTWNGYPILECPESSCKYDTIYERELNEHVDKAHSLPPVATPPRLLTLVDRFGNEQKG